MLTAERFANLTTPEPMSGCLLWLGDYARNGYGRLSLFGHVERAHRVAWMLRHGAIPTGLSVLHRCDNPACVNPAHLFLGTQADNIRDMVAKGRHAPGAFKLTTDAVSEIRRRVAEGEAKKAIAREFGLAPKTVRQIVKRETWR